MIANNFDKDMFQKYNYKHILETLKNSKIVKFERNIISSFDYLINNK